jgi:hypothetical protein
MSFGHQRHNRARFSAGSDNNVDVLMELFAGGWVAMATLKHRYVYGLFNVHSFIS